MAKHCWHIITESLTLQSVPQLVYGCCNCKRRVAMQPQLLSLNDPRRTGHGEYLPLSYFLDASDAGNCIPPVKEIASGKDQTPSTTKPSP